MDTRREIVKTFNESVLPLFFEGGYCMEIVDSESMQRSDCLYFGELPSTSSCAILLLEKSSGECASSITLEPLPRTGATLIEITSKTAQGYRKKGLNTFLRMITILIVPFIYTRAEYLISDAESAISRTLNQRLGFCRDQSSMTVYRLRLGEPSIVDRVIRLIVSRFSDTPKIK